MGNFCTDNEDLQYYLGHGVDWPALFEVSEYGRLIQRLLGQPEPAPSAGEPAVSLPDSLAFYREVAELVGEIAANEIAPRAAELDRDPPRLVDGEVIESPATRAIFERLRSVDLHRLCVPRELGGMNAPLLLYFINAEMVARADVSTMTHHSFHGGMAMALLVWSVKERTTTFDPVRGTITRTRFAEAIEEISSGVAWGAMDITEPDAGSDMAALRTRAEQDPDGNWLLSGQKIFISSGHAKYHFVVARTEPATSSDDPYAGLGGLSMFLVKAYDDLPDGTRRRYLTIERLEEKLGHHGSATTALSFERTPGQLIGGRGEGFRNMLVLMNNARIGVGIECIGLAEAAVRLAESYASERRSMGKPLAQHEMIADYLDEMRSDIVGLRALAVQGAFHEEMASKLGLVLQFTGEHSPERAQAKQADHAYHQARSRRFTPLLKYLAAEKAVEIARRALQIHGGVGYTRDYGVEKLLRDAIVLPIYEGTSQIQSLMAMKDTMLGIIRQPAAFVRRTAQARWRSLSARDPLERRVAALESLSLGVQQHLLRKTATAKLRTLGGLPLQSWAATLGKSWDPKRDFALAQLHAERLTRVLCDEAICELLLAQAQAHPERRPWLERYLERAEPRCRSLATEITESGERILGTLRYPA